MNQSKNRVICVLIFYRMSNNRINFSFTKLMNLKIMPKPTKKQTIIKSGVRLWLIGWRNHAQVFDIMLFNR